MQVSFTSALEGGRANHTIGRVKAFGLWRAADEPAEEADRRAVVRALRKRGARTGQAMFGGCFFARPPRGHTREALFEWLRSEAIPTLELPIARLGARLRPTRSA